MVALYVEREEVSNKIMLFTSSGQGNDIPLDNN
jgi:hypothetical protein